MSEQTGSVTENIVNVTASDIAFEEFIKVTSDQSQVAKGLKEAFDDNSLTSDVVVEALHSSVE